MKIFHLDRIGKNSVVVDDIVRMKGDMLNAKVNSWDTIIVVHE